VDFPSERVFGPFPRQVGVMISLMAVSKASIGQTVSPLPGVARRVQTLVKNQRNSANRVLIDLIETGLQARKRQP